MSRIARPVYGSGTSNNTIKPPSMLARPSGTSLLPSMKQTRSLDSSADNRNNNNATPDDVRKENHSMASSAIARSDMKKPKKMASRSSTSSTELSETDSRFSPSSKTSTPRSSWGRSTTSGTTEQQKTSLEVGHRVTVPSLGIEGTLRFLGTTEFKPGVWAGIELDTVGSGKNDGCVQGIRYFTCPSQTGLFILASKVEPAAEKRPSKVKLLPKVTRSSSTTTVAKRSKTLVPPPEKLQPSKTTVTRTPRRSLKSSNHSLMNFSNDNSPSPQPDKASKTEDRVQTPSGERESPIKTVRIAESTALAEGNEVQTTVVEEPKAAESNNGFTQEDLNRICDLLEKAQSENNKLMEQMRQKEAAWERLVSTKESYALRIKEKEADIARLNHQMETLRGEYESLQQALRERDASDEKKNSQDIDTAAALDMSKRRIEKLENTIQEMNAKANQVAETHKAQQDEYLAEIQELRQALKDQETMTRALEKECEELRGTGLEAIAAYEASVTQLKAQKADLEAQKNNEIQELQQTIEDLRKRISSLGMDDIVGVASGQEEEEGYAAQWHDQRRRLEEQLEIAMTELDHERMNSQALTVEISKLHGELQHLRIKDASSDDRFSALQKELEQEISDKRRLMEEADAAFEAQARAEDENYQLKMARVKLERELAEAQAEIQRLTTTKKQSEEEDTSENTELCKKLEQDKSLLEKECNHLRESQKDLENECIRLMDRIIELEKEQESEDALKQQIAMLKQELEMERQRYHDLELAKVTEINHLNQELAELETLVENNGFPVENNEATSVNDVPGV